MMTEFEKLDGNVKGTTEKSVDVNLTPTGGQHEVLFAISENLKQSNKRLKEANRELNIIFNKIGEAFFSIDVINRKVTQMSVACEKIYGYTPMEFKGNANLLKDVVHPADLDTFLEKLRKLPEVETVFHSHRIVHRNQGIRWVEIKIIPSLNNHGVLERLDGIATDITERKIADERLTESERRYRLVSENPLLGIGWASTEGNVINANDAFCKMLGYTHQEILSKHFSEFSHPDDLELEVPLFQRMVDGAIDNYQIEKRYFTSTHQIIWVLLNLSSVLKPGGEIDYFIGIIQDITMKKKAMEEAEENFKKILDNETLMKTAEGMAHFGSFQVDLPDDKNTWSDGCFRIFGYGPGEIKPSKEFFLSHIHPDDVGNVQKILADALKHTDGQKLNFRIIDKNGGTKYIRSELIIERDDEGKAMRLTGFNQDISEKILLEKKLVKEKIQKQKQLTAAVLKAQENERKFLAEELHDNINQLLATSRLFIDSALLNVDERMALMEQSKRFISTAMDEIRQLSKSLLPPSLGEISLVDAIDHMIGNMNCVEETNFDLCREALDENLLSDKLKLAIYRIIQEQLNNVLKHSKAKNVFIGFSQTGDILQLSIKDDGKGFDTKKERKGVGLQNIVSRSQIFNGSVSVISEPGKGCELIVSFNTTYSQSDPSL